METRNQNFHLLPVDVKPSHGIFIIQEYLDEFIDTDLKCKKPSFIDTKISEFIQILSYLLLENNFSDPQ